ncbi:transposable element Tcb2 transposase [Trichonephila clavipes]|nr:transposable element Tcb2 transposase [Trichonephila clavipes]
MSRRKQRSAFDQVYEFDRGRIEAYRDCELSFREIGSRVGGNQTTVMRICDRWMQEVSARTIRRRLQQSGLSTRRPLLNLPLTQNHRLLRRQWCDKRRMWAAEWNEVVFTDESRIYLQHHNGWIRVWRHRGERMLNSCVMHLLTGPVPGIMVWGGIGYHSRTPLVHIAGTLNSQRYFSDVLDPVVLPYLQGLATAIFQQDNARPHVARIFQRFVVNHQIEFLPWLAGSLSRSFAHRKHVVHGCSTIDPDYTPSCHTRSTLATCGSCIWSAVPQEHIQSLIESMPRRGSAVISNNGDYSGY